MADDLRTRVLLTAQRALLGAIAPEMRAVTVEWSPAEVCLRVYVDGPVSEQFREDFDAGPVTEMVAEFAYPDRGDPRVTFEIHRADAPTLLDVRGIPVFARAGTGFVAT
jgi:hypothetical protein